jgi:proteasome lid subunit RPN8/RPN11
MSEIKEVSWKMTCDAWNRVIVHAVRDYPKEACGILLCHSQCPRLITHIHPTRNVTSETPTTRYFLDPREYLEVLSWSENRALDICGFYHSHPDHPAIPSVHDEKFAWESYLYLIISTIEGMLGVVRAWIWNPVESRFEEVPVLPDDQEGNRETASSNP